MIIFLSELQKEHLKLLHQHSTQVLVDFCKLAIDYLNNGINHKKFSLAAEKLEVSQISIQNLVHALACLIVEGCKHNLLQSDFKSSLAIAGFSVQQQQVLVKLYTTKKDELSGALHILQSKVPTYQDFTWRFEIQIASRGHREEIKPMIMMDFVLRFPKYRGLNKDNQKTLEKDKSESNQSSGLFKNVSIQNAKTASQCQYIVKHHLLQCDLTNLLHLTNKLDLALKESKTQHVRKVQRALQ